MSIIFKDDVVVDNKSITTFVNDISDGNVVDHNTATDAHENRFNQYLPLSGGQLKGRYICRNVKDDNLQLWGGDGSDNGYSGGYLTLLGCDYSTEELQGAFQLVASKSKATTRYALTGRTNGLLSWGNLNLYQSGTISRPSDNSYLELLGGSANRTCARLNLYSSGHSYNGLFSLMARNENEQSELVGYPNGKLTWGNNNVLTSVDGAGHIYVKEIGNETEGNTLLDYAETLLSKGTIDMHLVRVENVYKQSVANRITPTTYIVWQVMHRIDTVWILGHAYSENVLWTNSRSRGCSWAGWQKIVATS